MYTIYIEEGEVLGVREVDPVLPLGAVLTRQTADRVHPSEGSTTAGLSLVMESDDAAGIGH